MINFRNVACLNHSLSLANTDEWTMNFFSKFDNAFFAPQIEKFRDFLRHARKLRKSQSAFWKGQLTAQINKEDLHEPN